MNTFSFNAPSRVTLFFRCSLALAVLALGGVTAVRALPTANPVWKTNYAEAVAQAKKENKKILLNFSGSDWCPWCLKLDQDVFNTAEFAQYARSHYVLVLADFPRRTPPPAALAQQNMALKEKFAPDEGFPTTVLLSPTEKPLNVLSGYVPSGPGKYLTALDKDYAAKT